MSIIRSYTHPSNAHEVGVYHTLTGKIDNTLAVPRNKRSRNDFPNTGAVVSYFSPPSAMPASVTIPKPIGHDGVIYTGTYAGFLGAQHDPMELKPPGEVNEAPPHSLDMLEGIDASRLQSRHRTAQAAGGPRSDRADARRPERPARLVPVSRRRRFAC